MCSALESIGFDDRRRPMALAASAFVMASTGANIAWSISIDVDPSGGPKWVTLLKASALACFLPGLCWMVNWKFAKVCSHLSSMPCGCSIVFMYSKHL